MQVSPQGFPTVQVFSESPPPHACKVRATMATRTGRNTDMGNSLTTAEVAEITSICVYFSSTLRGMDSHPAGFAIRSAICKSRLTSASLSFSSLAIKSLRPISAA